MAVAAISPTEKMNTRTCSRRIISKKLPNVRFTKVAGQYFILRLSRFLICYLTVREVKLSLIFQPELVMELEYERVVDLILFAGGRDIFSSPDRRSEQSYGISDAVPCSHPSTFASNAIPPQVLIGSN